jgi:hypothetical protein
VGYQRHLCNVAINTSKYSQSTLKLTTHTHTHKQTTHCISFSLSLYLTHTNTHTVSPSLSLTPTHTHTQTHTHTHFISLTHKQQYGRGVFRLDVWKKCILTIIIVILSFDYKYYERRSVKIHPDLVISTYFE